MCIVFQRLFAHVYFLNSIMYLCIIMCIYTDKSYVSYYPHCTVYHMCVVDCVNKNVRKKKKKKIYFLFFNLVKVLEHLYPSVSIYLYKDDIYLWNKSSLWCPTLYRNGCVSKPMPREENYNCKITNGAPNASHFQTLWRVTIQNIYYKGNYQCTINDIYITNDNTHVYMYKFIHNIMEFHVLQVIVFLGKQQLEIESHFVLDYFQNYCLHF
jgi:hypothetical protein